MKKRAALYVRVSTAEQRDHGLSVDSQIDALQKYCRENDLEVAGIYNDAGISARKKYRSRPALLQLIEDCKAKKVDVILFTKLDRWFRSVADYYEVQSQLDAARVPWRAIWEDYETETSAGVFKVNIMLSIAQAESDRTSERIRAVNEYRREQGYIIVGKMPVGYIRTSPSTIDFDPQAKEAMQAFFDTYLNTYSPALAIDAAARKGLKITRKTAHFLLNKEPYYGTYYGVSVPGYITPKQHELILQARIHYPRQPKKNRTYIFTGLVFCSCCGARMGAKCARYSAYGECREKKFYQCRTKITRKGGCEKSAFMMEHNIESYLLEHMNELIDDYNMNVQKANKKIENAKDEVKKVKGKLGRLKDVYLDGDISRSEYVGKVSVLKDQLAELERLTTPTPTVKQMSEGWGEVYHQLSEEGKRDFWHRVVRKIEVKGRTIDKVYFI